MSEAAGRVIVIGDVMTDVIVIPEGPLVRGSDRRAQITQRPGGSGATQAVWLGSMGTPVSFVARVGAKDKPHLEAYLRGFHVDPVLIADPVWPSGVLVIIVDADGERSFLTDRGANLLLSHSDMPVWLLEETRYVLVSGYSLFAEKPRHAAQWMAAEAQARGIPVAVDAASVGFVEEVGAQKFLEWTKGFSTLFANEDEAVALAGTTAVEAQMRLLGPNYGRVIVKLGAGGAAVGDARGVSLRLSAPTVNVVDTTGAGDAFAAAFVSAELRGADVETCLRRGIEAGSSAVTKIGGQPD
jgi:sugar/nucleoside kinase (ribokinase family)